MYHKKKTVAKAAELVKSLEEEQALLLQRIEAARADHAEKLAVLAKLEAEKGPLLAAMQARQKDLPAPPPVEPILAQMVILPKGFADDPGISSIMQHVSKAQMCGTAFAPPRQLDIHSYIVCIQIP